MNGVQNFAFETNLVRVVMKDGEPWFVAADICRALSIKNTAQAVEKLDPDEKGICLTDTLGGPQELLVVSEGGLHTITLRSHAAITPGTTAHRFRKWVTSEVLPSIRKTGAFGVSREAPDGLIAMNEQRLALDMVSEARRLYGPARGRLLWETLGLPHVPPLAEVFDASGHDCLAFLLKHETHNGSLHELVLAALRSGDDAALRPFGLRIEPEFNGLLVASSFRALAKLFAASDWRNGAWTRALRSLPGSVPWKVTKFTRADPVSKCTFVRAEHAEGPARASA